MNTSSMAANQLLDILEQKIAAHKPSGYDIVLHRDDYRHDGRWWYFVVHPTKENVRASEYSRNLETIENEIKNEQGVDVLLVPTIED
jgi:hypothetical protein